MVLTSIKPDADIDRAVRVRYLPSRVTLEHYETLFEPHELRRQPAATA